jgi:hypothetical protein
VARKNTQTKLADTCEMPRDHVKLWDCTVEGMQQAIRYNMSHIQCAVWGPPRIGNSPDSHQPEVLLSKLATQMQLIIRGGLIPSLDALFPHSCHHPGLKSSGSHLAVVADDACCRLANDPHKVRRPFGA